MNDARTPIVILGAGPAGLGAALQLARRGKFEVTVLERNDAVGGNAGSFELAGLNVDYGSHRLHPSCPPEVLTDIQSLLGPDLLDRPRHGRIRLRGRWLHFPLKPANLALHTPPTFILGVLRDAILKSGKATGDENFASVLQCGLGRTICRDFYFPYAEKIWGVSPDQLDAEQARRRVSAGSLTKLVGKVLKLVPGLKRPGAGRFFYPKGGYGQISEAYHRAALNAGAKVRLKAQITSVDLENGRAVSVGVAGEQERIPSRLVLSTIPVTALIRLVRPEPPAEVIAAASELAYRSMILIYLVLDSDRFTEYDAHYFPESTIKITRLSEPKNYCLAELPGKTVLCAELPCSTADEVWQFSDVQLGELVRDALAKAGIPIKVPIRQVVSRRLPQAYPIYARGYRQHFEKLDDWVGKLDGIITLGRQGLFAHDNTHHTLAMAYAAADCTAVDGTFDRGRWATYRREFESYVVED